MCTPCDDKIAQFVDERRRIRGNKNGGVVFGHDGRTGEFVAGCQQVAVIERCRLLAVVWSEVDISFTGHRVGHRSGGGLRASEFDGTERAGATDAQVDDLDGLLARVVIAVHPVVFGMEDVESRSQRSCVDGAIRHSHGEFGGLADVTEVGESLGYHCRLVDALADHIRGDPFFELSEGGDKLIGFHDISTSRDCLDRCAVNVCSEESKA